MPRKSAPSSPKPVEAIVHHNDKRPNLPTADAHDLVAPEIETSRIWYANRRPELDPQLVWKGKEEQDQRDLEVAAPPIYIQEKIDPRVLVENLRRTTQERSEEPELTLFDVFDGLNDLELVEFYQHDANWSNRMILGDSLNAMASLAEREGLRGKVQMAYIDPPYGIKFGSNWQATIGSRQVKDGRVADAAREVEQIRAFRDTWELGIHSYLAYLRDRFVVTRDLLAQSGSVVVQIGDSNVHLVRAVLDEVFGSDNFISQITFQKTGSQEARFLGTTVDYLLLYGKDKSATKFRQLYQRRKAGDLSLDRYDQIELPDGSSRRLRAAEIRDNRIPDGRRFQTTSLLSDGASSTAQEFEYEGRLFKPPAANHWKTPPTGLARLAAAGRLLIEGSTLRYKRYADDFDYIPVADRWESMQIGRERDYVVQTATSVVERCLLLTTDPGDLVIDPTCGSGTTAFVAEQWGRRWITIDTSRVALAVARQRLMGASFPYYLLADSESGRAKERELTGQPIGGEAPRSDIRDGFVYERTRHVTLKSIATDPDMVPGLDRSAAEQLIAKHAELELLRDRPFEDKRKVRVAGPFTIESLSPHRSLAFAPASEPVSIREAAKDPNAETLEDTILANLAKAGIQNGRKHERLDFQTVDAYGGTYVQSVGERRDAASGPARVAISIGPQYGTVGPAFIKGAAREAIKDESIDLLCVLGFAFDPTALGAADGYNATSEGFANVAGERSLGRMPVLLVRMNADLVMGEDLKKTGAGNLFTVFGEPDIDVRKSGDQLEVEIKGVDVYDPTTGEVRSSDPDRIALWMVDTTYNGESFFVRHCYFTGGTDPYKRLKTALKADIDEEAWASLYRTTSRTFPRPDTGKIAVKVINDYGDEVLKVFDV